ncbi:hypothetical protein Tco_0290217 [Tanacetum coccineum]
MRIIWITHAQVDKSATEKNVDDPFGDILADNGEEFFNADVVNADVVNSDKEDADPQVGVHGDDAHDSDPFRLEPLINMKASKVLFQDISLHGELLFFTWIFAHIYVDVPIQRLEETIKVRLALGLNMEGCECTLAALIALMIS